VHMNHTRRSSWRLTIFLRGIQALGMMNSKARMKPDRAAGMIAALASE